MNRLLRLPALAALPFLAAVLTSLGGCATDCKEVDGKTVCESTTLTQYRGGNVTLATQAYTPGVTPRLRITVQGGNVRLGEAAAASITVGRGAAAGQITGFCVPIVALKDDEAAAAKSQMETNVTCQATTAADGTVTIDVFRTGKRDSSLTAQLSILVPDDFSGPIEATTESGDISLEGVRGPVTARITGIGTIGVSPASSILPSDGGSLYTNHGNVILTVPGGSALTVVARVDDQHAIVNSTEIAQTATSTATEVTLPFGQGQIWNLQSDFGDIEIRR